MSEATPPADAPSPAATSPSRARITAIQGLGAAAVFGVTLYLASWTLSNAHAQFVASAAVVALLFAIVVLLMIGAFIHDRSYWRRPREDLLKLLNELNSAEAPIDELNKVEGGFEPLREPLLDVFRQLRASRTEMAELQAEMSQRVATRTDALERKLGSLQAQASRDALTGLMNRRAMEIELPRIVSKCRGAAQPLQLLMIDVDHFKTLNDTLGHKAGDELLRSIGQLMRSSIRDGVDHAFRYGGDEFLIVMPGADDSAATTLADRLTRLVDGLTKHHRQLPRRPQLSIGISSLSQVAGMENPAAGLLALADERLYAIKHARPKSQQRVA